MNQSAKSFLLSITLIVVVVSLNSCNLFSKKGAVKNGTQEFPVVKVSKGNATIYADFAAEVESHNVVEICSRATGYIDLIAVREGSEVKKGELILKINDDEYQQKVIATEANVKAAQADVNNARLEIEKMTPLVQRNIISNFQLETAKSNLQAAEAKLTQARSQYNDAKISLSYTRITSPTNGVIGKLDIRSGSLVNAGAYITNVSAFGDVFAYFSFDEKKLLSMAGPKDGASIYEKMNSFPPVDFVMADGSIYESKGKLEIASGLINSKTGSMQLKGVFPNPSMKIRSGSTGRVRIPVHYEDIILIPQKATYELQDKKLVYLVDNDGKVTSKAIFIEGSSNGNYVVTGGIKEGDIIIYEGIDKIRDGMTITPKTVTSTTQQN